MKNISSRLLKVEEAVLANAVTAYADLTICLTTHWLWVQENCTPEQNTAFDQWLRGEALSTVEQAAFDAINTPADIKARVEIADRRLARFPMRMLPDIQERSEARVRVQLSELACSDLGDDITAEARDLLGEMNAG